MPYYRKKPILVEARQYTGDNFLELQDWSADHIELSDDLLDTRTSYGAIVRIRKGNETYRITRVNIIEATNEVEIECEEDD